MGTETLNGRDAERERDRVVEKLLAEQKVRAEAGKRYQDYEREKSMRLYRDYLYYSLIGGLAVSLLALILVVLRVSPWTIVGLLVVRILAMAFLCDLCVGKVSIHSDYEQFLHFGPALEGLIAPVLVLVLPTEFFWAFIDAAFYVILTTPLMVMMMNTPPLEEWKPLPPVPPLPAPAPVPATEPTTEEGDVKDEEDGQEEKEEQPVADLKTRLIEVINWRDEEIEKARASGRPKEVVEAQIESINQAADERIAAL